MKKSRLRPFLPSFITLINLMCGFVAILYAGNAEFVNLLFLRDLHHSYLALSGYVIFAAMIADMCDGWAARLTGAVSKIGAELDNLGDMVSFGAAPAFLMLRTLDEPLKTLRKESPREAALLSGVVFVAALMYLLCAALRLARFSVESAPPAPGEKAVHQDFTGLPSPVAAGLVAGLVVFREHFLREASQLPALAGFCEKILPPAMPFITLVISFLMVSRIPYLYLPDRLKPAAKNVPYIGFILFNLALAVVSLPIALPAGFLGYTFLAIKRRPKKTS